MQKRISRRRFLKGATLLGGSMLLAAAAHDAAARTEDDARVKPTPYRPTEEEVARAFARQDDYEALVRKPVYKARIAAHWFGDGTRFWYRNDLPQARSEFILVDAQHGVRAAAFDHAKLASALAAASGAACDAHRLPFREIAFVDDAKAVQFAVDDKVWRCDLSSYAVTHMAGAAMDTIAHDGERRERGSEPQDSEEQAPQDLKSPDGNWTAFLKDNNLYVRSAAGAELARTTDGTAERPYGEPQWSPDSRSLVAYRIDPVPVKPVYMVESSPADGGTRGVLHQHEYMQPGDPFSRYEMWIVPADGGAPVKAQIETIDYGDAPELHWREGGGKFLFARPDRGHQRYRVVEVDTATGKARNIIDEQAHVFINTSNVYTHYTHGAAEIIYASEQDGWRHLYLYDVESGSLKNRITQGDWVVRSVEKVDEAAREIWFQASGRNAGEDPYLLHHYRVGFDGQNLTALTDGNGSHLAEYSPDRRYLIDTYSRADMPPVHTLRRAADGSHVCDLEKADASALLESGWRMPEVFSAKGRDGVTDIWGVVFRPTHFDPKRKYPIIENIYAGPQDSFVRKTFSVRDGMQELAELGFIVVQCDGMGTRNRSKAFHDVCWRNIKDAGFPDRIAWIKALAAKYPYCDTDRVGIYGTSAGGQNSTGALLFHPEFYKVAVSSCGCHDNRIDKQWWNEQWMGYPVGPWYADNSNITHAANLRGKLMLFVGELDTNVPPESTIRLTDALMKADKDFELVVITGSDHTSGGAYGERRRRDFFVRHLLGVEPPDRNAPKPKLAVVTLTAHPAGDAILAQTEGGPDTTVEFRNETAVPVALFWLSEGGKRTPYATVEPGKSYVQHTYSGHSWLVATEDGKPLQVFVAETHPGIAVIKTEH